jgi:hypothetical protein
VPYHPHNFPFFSFYWMIIRTVQSPTFPRPT